MNTVNLRNTDIILLLQGSQVFVNAPELLEDIDASQATQMVKNCPHSIAEIIGHLHAWQSWTYDCIHNNIRKPPTDEENWSKFAPEEWDALRTAFLERLLELQNLCGDTKLLNQPYITSEENESDRTIALELLLAASHNAHHFGQIITIRQMLEHWPPKAGGMIF